MKLGSTFVLLVLLAGCVGTEQRIAEERAVVGDKVALARQITEPKTWTSANGETLPYRLYVPAKPQEGRKYPLVIHMHGAGSRGTDNANQMNAGGSDFLSWMTRRGPFQPAGCAASSTRRRQSAPRWKRSGKI